MDGTDPHRHNEYGKPSKTLRGEAVKSQGEKQIADYFYRNRIKYVYEDRAKTTKSAFRNRISRPDFYLPEHEVYVEYWGMVDVGDTEQRNKYRSDMKWKMKQYDDNGIRFISLYPWHLNDLDGAFRAQYKEVMKRDLVAGPVGEKSVYALPIPPEFKRALLFRVPDKIQLAGLELQYVPHYFVEYDCFTQATFFYERVNVASHGILVIEGQKGQVVDSALQSGVAPAIVRSGQFAQLASIEQKETPRSAVASGEAFSKFEAVAVRITKYDAERITGIEVAKNLSQTFSRRFQNGRVETKTVRPYVNQVKVVSTRLANVPIVTAVFQYKDRTYRRVMQATTNCMIADSLNYCDVEGTHFSDSILLCDECGRLACNEHGKSCSVCGKGLCQNHVVSKGLIIKKHYCSNHVPVGKR